MRWNAPLYLALLLPPASAWAQADDPLPETAPSETAASETAASETAAEEPTDWTADPRTTTSSVTINAGEADLRREQEQMIEQTAEPTQEDELESGERLDHEFQLGLRGGIGVPFLFALRYAGGSQCNNAHDQFCVAVGSAVATFDLSFGVSEDIEVVAGGRVGVIGVEPTQTNNLQLLLGIRAYISPADVAKLYLAPSVILDLTEAGNPPEPNWSAVDFGVRGAFGLQVDLVRYFGLYAELGVNLMFLRSFTISPDLQAGLQVRFP